VIFKYAKDKRTSQNIGSVSVKPFILFEQLEPRILLSVDSLLNIAPDPLQETILDNTSLTDQRRPRFRSLALNLSQLATWQIIPLPQAGVLM
jgi:hypothetical protein